MEYQNILHRLFELFYTRKPKIFCIINLGVLSSYVIYYLLFVSLYLLHVIDFQN